VGGTLPLGYEMKDGKIAVIEEEVDWSDQSSDDTSNLAASTNCYGPQRTQHPDQKTRLLSTGATRGGIQFGRGALYYLLSNRFYIGEVKYKNEILPGEQPPIMDRALFEAVRRNPSPNVPPHRRAQQIRSIANRIAVRRCRASHDPTHATKAGIRYRYYVSTPFLHGEARPRQPGRSPAFPPQTSKTPSSNPSKSISPPNKTGQRRARDAQGIARSSHQLVAGIVVHKDRLIVRLKSDNADQASIPRKIGRSQFPGRNHPPKKSARSCSAQCISKRRPPEQFERRARLVSATISLAFLAPNLVKAAVEGRLPRASASSGSAIRRPNGVGSLRRSDLIRSVSESATPKPIKTLFRIIC